MKGGREMKGEEEREEEVEEEGEGYLMSKGNNGPMERRLLSTNQSDHCSASQGEESVRGRREGKGLFTQ